MGPTGHSSSRIPPWVELLKPMRVFGFNTYTHLGGCWGLGSAAILDLYRDGEMGPLHPGVLGAKGAAAASAGGWLGHHPGQVALPQPLPSWH